MSAPETDTRLMRLGDLPAALGLLTRLPVPLSAAAMARGARAAWAWPLAGLLPGGLAVALALAALAAGLGPVLAAGLALVAQVMVTGALHEDGLADCADGFWGGQDPARRLEIMKDSHIGSYGVMALILVTGLRWGALAALLALPGGWMALPVAAVVSRAAMVVVMAALPNARGRGLSARVGRPGAATTGGALLAGLTVALALAGLAGLGAVLAAALATLAVAAVARAKIGGQTGDVLGATQQLTEAATLLALLALLQ